MRPPYVPRSASLPERLLLRSVESFLGWTDPTTNEWSPCRLWTGQLCKGGYGHIGFLGEYIGAHRAAYRVEHGSIPEGLFICHHCDRPSCINPKHLFAGTHQDNMADMVRKLRAPRGRNRPPKPAKVLKKARRGEAQHCAKLTEADVLAIYVDPRTSGIIADQYGVDRSQISKIKRGVYWGWLTCWAKAPLESIPEPLGVDPA